jgi:hypothetical protein
MLPIGRPAARSLRRVSGAARREPSAARAGPAFFDAAANGIPDAIASVQESPADISGIVVML